MLGYWLVDLRLKNLNDDIGDSPWVHASDGKHLFDPNGMQGGPVFAVVVENRKLVLKFAGIISKVDSHVGGKITFIRFDAIKKFLDMIVDMSDDMRKL